MNRWLSPELADLANNGNITVTQRSRIKATDEKRGGHRSPPSMTRIESLFQERSTAYAPHAPHAPANRHGVRRTLCLRAAALALLCASAAFSYVAWSDGVGSVSANSPWRTWVTPSLPSTAPDTPLPHPSQSPSAAPAEAATSSVELRDAVRRLREKNHALLERLARLENHRESAHSL